MKIETRSRVAIVGGGPAGSFFALYLQKYAAEQGIQPEVTIYQARDFDEPGPKGCKGCAGVLSLSLLKNLDELSLSLPEEIIRSRIENYTVHSPYTSITISNPEKGRDIISIYRGGGPRISHYEDRISFDGWLLRQAESRGAMVARETVSGIYLGNETGIEVDGQRRDYDLVVMAAGINARHIPIQGLNYHPPKTQIMTQDELYAGADRVESQLGNTAHVFLLPNSNLIFGTLVPKGAYINVSVLSSSKRPISVSDFLKYDIVRKVLTEKYEHACGCRPRTVTGAASNYYTDRFITIGDAAVTRLYKDGIGSSLLTAREATRSVIFHGVARQDFERYYQPLCRSIKQDNAWGHRLFRLNDKAKESAVFLATQQRLIGDEQGNLSGRQPFTRAAWGMFTGSYNYRDMARMTLNPVSLAMFSATFLAEGFKKLLGKGNDGSRKLEVGNRKVLILGNGFGGTYALRHLVPLLNRNENVETTMVSEENFFLFSPLLHEVAMGRIETRHIAYPIRRLHWRDRFNFVQASIEKIDLNARKVITDKGILDFDYLILALGSVTNLSGVNSARANVFTLKTLRDSMLIRNHIISIFEQASTEKDPERLRQLLTFIVSGAGYTGVQLVTELWEFVHRGLTRYYRTIDPAMINIILVESAAKIVAELHTRLGDYVMKHLQDKGIDVRLKSRITDIQEDHVIINGKQKIATGTVLWVAGVVANPRIAELDVEKDSINRVMVNEYMEVPGMTGVYAVGDCAHFNDPKSGQPIPPRAHTAVRQAKVAAGNILANIRGRDKKPYRYSYGAEIVTLGGSDAVFRFNGLRLYGFPARLIWLVGYSLLVTGAYNRTRIITDWFLSLVFGRDTTYLKLTR